MVLWSDAMYLRAGVRPWPRPAGEDTQQEPARQEENRPKDPHTEFVGFTQFCDETDVPEEHRGPFKNRVYRNKRRLRDRGACKGDDLFGTVYDPRELAILWDRYAKKKGSR